MKPTIFRKLRFRFGVGHDYAKGVKVGSPKSAVGSNTFCRARKVSGRKWRRNLGLGKNERVGSILVGLVYRFGAFLVWGGGGGSALTKTCLTFLLHFPLRTILIRTHCKLMVSKQFQIWRNWKWSPVVKRGEINRFLCILITNNVKLCTKFYERAQTANFSVLSRLRQELCAENPKNLENKKN